MSNKEYDYPVLAQAANSYHTEVVSAPNADLAIERAQAPKILKAYFRGAEVEIESLTDKKNEYDWSIDIQYPFEVLNNPPPTCPECGNVHLTQTQTAWSCECGWEGEEPCFEE